MSGLGTLRNGIYSLAVGAIIGIGAQSAVDRHAEHMMEFARRADRDVARLAADIPRKNSEIQKNIQGHIDVGAEIRSLAGTVAPITSRDFLVIDDILKKYEDTTESIIEQVRFLRGIHAGLEERVFPRATNPQLTIDALFHENVSLRQLGRDLDHYNEKFSSELEKIPAKQQQEIRKAHDAYKKFAALLADATRSREDVLRYIKDNLPLAATGEDNGHHSVDTIVHREIHTPSLCDVRKTVDGLVNRYHMLVSVHGWSQAAATKDISHTIIDGAKNKDTKDMYLALQSALDARGSKGLIRALEFYQKNEGKVDAYRLFNGVFTSIQQIVSAARETREHLYAVRGGLRRVTALQERAELELEDVVKYGRREMVFRKQLVEQQVKEFIIEFRGYQAGHGHYAPDMHKRLERLYLLPVVVAVAGTITSAMLLCRQRA